jgi:hypothetical protein
MQRKTADLSKARDLKDKIIPTGPISAYCSSHVGQPDPPSRQIRDKSTARYFIPVLPILEPRWNPSPTTVIG